MIWVSKRSERCPLTLSAGSPAPAGYHMISLQQKIKTQWFWGTMIPHMFSGSPVTGCQDKPSFSVCAGRVSLQQFSFLLNMLGLQCGFSCCFMAGIYHFWQGHDPVIACPFGLQNANTEKGTFINIFYI